MEGTTYTFGVSGDLYNSNLLLYDKQTDSRWLQLTGVAVEGPLTGKHLKMYPVAYDRWDSWKEHHPNGKVLGIPAMYARRFGTYDDAPYAGYELAPGVWFHINHLDERLPRKARVFGIEARGAYKAYPESVVWGKAVLEDRLKDVEVVILADRPSSRIGAFLRGRHTFRLSDGDVRDEAGRIWTWDGNELSLGSERIESFPVIATFWFAWAAMHLDTSVYKEPKA